MNEKARVAGAIAVVVLFAIACNDGSDRSQAAAPAEPVGDAAYFRLVHTGGTIGVFLLADGLDERTAKVHVIGVSTCGPETGQAEAARSAVDSISTPHDAGSERVLLTKEPLGPDTDASGALLRHVRMGDGTDLGELLVSDPHIGVATEGPESKASAEYLARLRQADVNGRDCKSVDPVVPDVPPGDGGSSDLGPAPYVANGDGNDGESRFCRHHRWC